MTIQGLQGTSWPWKVYPKFEGDENTISAAILDVIRTSTGERKKNTAWGSQVMSLVFENKGLLLAALARREISIAIAQQLPMITVLNIDVQEGEQDTDPVDISVDWEYQGIEGTVKSPLYVE